MDLDKIRKEAFAAGHAHGYCSAKLSGDENWIHLYEKWVTEEPLIIRDAVNSVCKQVWNLQPDPDGVFRCVDCKYIWDGETDY